MILFVRVFLMSEVCRDKRDEVLPRDLLVVVCPIYIYIAAKAAKAGLPYPELLRPAFPG